MPSKPPPWEREYKDLPPGEKVIYIARINGYSIVAEAAWSELQAQRAVAEAADALIIAANSHVNYTKLPDGSIGNCVLCGAIARYNAAKGLADAS